jgi:hypothetical protein
MAGGIVGKPAHDLEPVPCIERGRLKGVRIETDLDTSPVARLRLGRGEKLTPDTPPAASSRTHSASIQHVPPQLHP